MGNSQNGWPNDPPRSARTPGNSDARIVVADGAPGDLLMYVATQFDLRVENLELPGAEDEWGWASYATKGNNWSNHRSATAIDLNATRHPFHKRGTFNSAQVSQIRAILNECEGLVAWGGNWSGDGVDEMHFEIVGSSVKVHEWVARHNHTPNIPNRPTIQQGSKGQYVADLQRVLNAWYPNIAPRLVVDGDFGPLTDSRVRYAQTALGLVVDGIVGPKTWYALGFR